eukprot:212218-Rhodomonas_salina.1
MGAITAGPVLKILRLNGDLQRDHQLVPWAVLVLSELWWHVACDIQCHVRQELDIRRSCLMAIRC